VDHRHLGRKHGLELIPRFNTFEDRQHEIEPALVDVLTTPICVGELAHNAAYKAPVSRREGVHHERMAGLLVRMV
jgi:hypothetical protein